MSNISNPAQTQLKTRDFSLQVSVVPQVCSRLHAFLAIPFDSIPWFRIFEGCRSNGVTRRAGLFFQVRSFHLSSISATRENRLP